VKEYQETQMIHCVAPKEMQDGDLLAFVEGEASATVRTHVARCLYCSQEAAALRQVDFLLVAAFERAECPESDLLLGYQTGMLSSAENKRVKRHVQDCRDCQGELAELMGESPPSRLNRLTTAASQSLREVGKQVIGAVLLPTQPRPSLALRGENQQSAVYQAGSYRITLAKIPPLAGSKVW
jgi:hypothetical protein